MMRKTPSTSPKRERTKNAGAPLHPQLMQLAALFDFLDDTLVWLKDRDGRYQWVNRAFLVSYSAAQGGSEAGATEPPVIGKTDYDLSPPFLADQFRLDDEYVLAGHRILNRIELVGTPPDTEGWHVTNKIPITDATGDIVGTAGMTRPLDQTATDAASGLGLGAVLAYIRDHYAGHVGNQQLARLAHMSVRAFERNFLATFHVTPQKYVRRLRMRMASRALVFTSKPLSEVAAECGFPDQSHFSREFRRHFDRTPRAYRDHYRRAALAAAFITKKAALDQ